MLYVFAIRCRCRVLIMTILTYCDQCEANLSQDKDSVIQHYNYVFCHIWIDLQSPTRWGLDSQTVVSSKLVLMHLRIFCNFPSDKDALLMKQSWGIWLDHKSRQRTVTITPKYRTIQCHSQIFWAIDWQILQYMQHFSHDTCQICLTSIISMSYVIDNWKSKDQNHPMYSYLYICSSFVSCWYCCMVLSISFFFNSHPTNERQRWIREFLLKGMHNRYTPYYWGTSTLQEWS